MKRAFATVCAAIALAASATAELAEYLVTPGVTNGLFAHLAITWQDGKVERRPMRVVAERFGQTALPDAAVEFFYGVRQYIRPSLRPYGIRHEMVPAGYLAVTNWTSFPPASTHPLRLGFDRGPGGRMRLWIEGSYIQDLSRRDAPDIGVADIAIEPSTNACVERLPAPTTAIDAERYLPLRLETKPLPGTFAEAVYAKAASAPPLEAGLLAPGGEAPIFAVAPAAAPDVGRCRAGKKSWALEVDEYTGRSPLDGFPEAIHYRVPAAVYTRAHLLFVLDDDPKRVPVLTVRLARYINNGSGANMIGDRVFDLSDGATPPNATKVGELVRDGRVYPVYRLAVDLALDNVMDLVADGGYLDFELLGKCSGVHADNASTSAFTILGATLEKSPVTLGVIAPEGASGNVFTLDETNRHTTLSVRAERAGARAALAWTARDIAGQTVFAGSRDLSFARFGDTEEIRLDLNGVHETGLYLLDVAVDDGATVVTNKARFAILPPAGRVVDKFRSPYATWWFVGSHGSPAAYEIGGTIMRKAGIRKASYRGLSTNACDTYDITFTGNVRAPGQKNFDAETGHFKDCDGLSGEEWFRSEVQKQIDAVPWVDHILIWHESCPPSGIPEELLDLPVPEATDADRAAGAYVNECGRLIRKYFPKLRIQIGNSSASLGAAFRPFRGGANPDYYDSIGIETPSQAMMPERLLVWGLQGMVIARDAASRYAGREVPLAGCWEYVYRTEKALGEEVQAQWYMRDVLISLANRMSLISPAILFDVRSGYYNTLWGKAGMLLRAPSCYPKRSYVAYAALTKALDGVTFLGQHDTGSTTVYGLSFKRADGRYASAFWCARGEAELALTLSGAAEATDMYGRPAKIRRGILGGPLRITASEGPVYVVSEKPVAAVKITGRTFRQAEAAAARCHEVFRFDSVAAVTNAPDPRIESKWHLCLPIMKPSSDFSVKEVDDAERGRCLEVMLDTSRTNVSKYVTEYTTLRLAEPIEVAGPANRIGIWVKGNSSWGQVRFELEDAEGGTFVNYSHPKNWDTLDWQGLLCVNFDGWSFVSVRLDKGGLKYDDATGLSNSPWLREAGKGSQKIDFPVKLKAVTVGINREKLDLLDFKRTEPSIRLGPVMVGDE